MLVAQLVQFVVRAHILGLVEIVGTHGGEDYEGGVFRIERNGMKSCTIEEHASRAFADLRDLCGYARTARKSSKCAAGVLRSEEHTSELQSLRHLVCRLLLEKKKKYNTKIDTS